MNAADSLSPLVPDAEPDAAEAMALGATMYVPIVHPDVGAIIAGDKHLRLRSVVLCLEDALHARDVERGLHLLSDLLSDPAANGAPLGRASGPRLFLRPRDLVMARRIVRLEGIAKVHGFVIPKVATETLAPWWRLAEEADLRLMPTLERAWVFDPIALREFAHALDDQDRRQLVALRVGGNDLLASMGLRRVRGRTVYEGPLAWGLSQLMCQLGSHGYPLTAPVFDVLDDPDTLARECRLDAEFGFVGKTAVHPAQIRIIERGFAVTEATLTLAREALADDADAVFRREGLMLEPATHRAWARRTVARAAAYGTCGS